MSRVHPRGAYWLSSVRLWTLALLIAAIGFAQVGRAQPPPPDICVTKTADKSVVCVGETITYTVTVENRTGLALRVTKIADTLPGIIITPSVPKNLPIDATVCFTYCFTPTEAGTLSNCVKVTAKDKNPDTDLKFIGTATACVTVEEEAACPDITVTKTANTRVTKVGDCVCYTVTIKNEGDTAVEITRVEDTLVCPLPPGVLAVLLGVLEPEECVAATYCYTVQPCDDVAPYILCNTVKVFGALVEESDTFAPPSDGNPQIGCASAEVCIVHPCLKVFKWANVSSADPGQPIKWYIKIVNCGDVALENIKVCDALLGGTLTGFCTTLAPGADETKCIDWCVPSNARDCVTNVVIVTANPECLPNVLTATATASVPVNAPVLCPSICIEKTADKECARPGEKITYTIRVKNGPVALTNVQVTDPFFGSGPMPNFPTCLAPGQIVVKTVCFTVPSGPPSSCLTNTVTVRGCAGSTVVTDSATATVYIIRANLTITAAPCGPACPGKPVKILVTIKNTGNGTANDIWVSSNVPGGTWSGSCTRSLAPGCTATGYYTLCVPSNAPSSLPIGFKVTYKSENLPCCLEKTTAITIPVQR